MWLLNPGIFGYKARNQNNIPSAGNIPKKLHEFRQKFDSLVKIAIVCSSKPEVFEVNESFILSDQALSSPTKTLTSLKPKHCSG